jgi:hypothetical protein
MSQKSSVPQAVSFVSRVLKRDTEYLREIVGDLEATVAPCKIQLDAPEAVQFVADRSILVGLIVPKPTHFIVNERADDPTRRTRKIAG